MSAVTTGQPDSSGRPRSTAAAPSAPAQDLGRVLVVDDDELVLALVRSTLDREGYAVTTAVTGAHALEQIEAGLDVDLVLSDVNMPDMDGFELLARLRADAGRRALPLIFLTSRGAKDDVITGLRLGADDYLVKPFDLDELRARVRSKIERPPVPVDLLPVDRRTGLVSAPRFREELEREHGRAARGGRTGAVAALRLQEVRSLVGMLDPRTPDIVARQLAVTLARDGAPLDLATRRDDDTYLLLLPETDPAAARQRIEALLAAIMGQVFKIGTSRVRLTPSVGWAAFDDAPDPAAVVTRARTALEESVSRLDLQPTRWSAAMDARLAARRAERQQRRGGSLPGRLLARFRTPIQIALTLLAGFVVPFLTYWAFDAAGFDITPAMYLIVVVALLGTGALIIIEGLFALERPEPPLHPGAPHPTASAIIAAYLPNEAATIFDTLEAFLRVDYPGELQVILAYNTPQPMPAVEERLAAFADLHPRITIRKVEGSTSKAQNVNAALAEVRGRFVGVFDADHQPDPDSFTRAWRWLSNGYDVVQGHCLVRNGDASHVARLIAVEFELIYAVSHPGRARMHDFGIFGGSNGYWHTNLLRETRMRGTMLTEDIDSSLRVIEAGGRIASDPALISRELATTTWAQVWNQRMRWAQGWFQVSLRHLLRGLRSPHLSLRQKLGLVHLLGWREVYPWLSLQMFPIIAYWVWQRGSAGALDWHVPIFVLTTIFTMSVGPVQAYFALRLGHVDVVGNRRWVLRYLLGAATYYTEYKNVIARVAQVKEAMRERAWKVTPRSTPAEETS